ncbi:hypothetical protein K8S19_10570 [bacterium]|nr:hypothetical protein [bacterium]
MKKMVLFLLIMFAGANAGNVLAASTETFTPTLTMTETITPTITLTPTITQTDTLTPTVTPTATISQTYTMTPTITLTPTITQTSTISPTSTITPTNTEVINVLVSINHNYFYPLRGETLRINYLNTLHEAVTIKVFSQSGTHIKTLLDKETVTRDIIPEWDGKNEQGETVASGVYIVMVKGKKLHKRFRVALIK